MNIKLSKTQWEQIGKKAGWLRKKSQGSKRAVVKEDVEYRSPPYAGTIATIPKGTPCSYAQNLPDGGWWVEAWDGMNDFEESWHRNYGFLLSDEEVQLD